MRYSLIPLLLLGACATAPKPEIRIQRVYCVTPKQYTDLKNAEPAKVGGTLTGNAQKDFKIVAGQDVLLRQYSDGLLEVIGGCMG